MKDKHASMFMDYAIRASKESNCVKYHVGCVIVQDGHVVLHGYNGTVSGFTNCSEKFAGLAMDIEKNRLEHHKWSSAFEVHAEMNAIAFAAKHGVKTDGATMYITHKPCNPCLKHLIPAGIKKIVYLEDYVDPNNQADTEKLMKFIEIEQYEQ